MKEQVGFGLEGGDEYVDHLTVAVHFLDTTTVGQRKKVIDSMSFCDSTSFLSRIEVPKERYTLFSISNRSNKSPQDQYQEVVRRLDKNRQVVRVNKVFSRQGKKIFATDRVLIGFNTFSTQKKMALLSEYRFSQVNPLSTQEYIVYLKEDQDALAVAERFQSHQIIAYAEPDFLTMTQPIVQQQDAQDPLLLQQYVPTITQAAQAWEQQAGRPTIRIAILDEGVDVHHEDLQHAIVATFDAIDGDRDQQPNAWDGHGTACAGLAAAQPNNEKGIRGIGGGCSILGVRIAYSETKGGDWVFRNSWAVSAISWAWRQGRADIISNSWGGGLYSQAIAAAFERAQQYGRGGKGCIIVAAAGNESGPVSFPATLPHVLTVSASNQFDEFKTKDSQDGEVHWGSNFGSEVDLAAPGVGTLTTDTMGDGGYESGNYTRFNGTSSATPIVAGAAGLILSRNPQLRYLDVQQILRHSADKVGAMPYDEKGRNDEFGYGRLNVLNAITMTPVMTDQSKEDEMMKLGEGYDAFSNSSQESAILVDFQPSEIASGLAESKLGGKIVKLPYSPGSYQLRSFESLDELNKMVGGSLGLAATLPQVGLSLDVSAKKNSRVDANYIYYLLELKSGEYAYQFASVPTLNNFAKKTLGLQDSKILTEENKLAGLKATLAANEKAKASAKKNQPEAMKTEKASKEALDIAQEKLVEIQKLYNASASTQLLEQLIQAKKTLGKAHNTYDDAKTELKKINKAAGKDLSGQQQAVKASENRLSKLIAKAAQGVDEKKIEEFYRRFGTHYVQKASFGRQFTALITVDRYSAFSEQTLKLAGGLDNEYVTVNGEYEKAMEALAKKAIVNISISSDGIRTTAMRSPSTMAELQDAILAYLSPENHIEQPALIDFELNKYNDVLLNVGVPKASVRYLDDRLLAVGGIIDRLLVLRAQAIRYYATRYFHNYSADGSQSNPLISSNSLQLERDPHNRRLTYCFDQLRDIILTINDSIKTVQRTAFKDLKYVFEDKPVNVAFSAIQDAALAMDTALKNAKDFAAVDIARQANPAMAIANVPAPQVNAREEVKTTQAAQAAVKAVANSTQQLRANLTSAAAVNPQANAAQIAQLAVQKLSDDARMTVDFAVKAVDVAKKTFDDISLALAAEPDGNDIKKATLAAQTYLASTANAQASAELAYYASYAFAEAYLAGERSAMSPLLDLITAQLKALKDELEQRAGYRLLNIRETEINNHPIKWDIKDETFTVKVPEKATHFHLSVFNGKAEQVGDAIMPQTMRATGRASVLVPASEASTHSLTWPKAGDKVVLDVSQHREGRFGDKKICLYTARAGQQSTELGQEVRNGGDHFSVGRKKNAVSSTESYPATIRFFAARTNGRLDLSAESQDNKNIVARALEQKTLPETVTGTPEQKKCAIM